MPTNRASSKIQRVTYPAAPGKCVVCNNDANGQKEFLDFGADLDYYGAIVICTECAVQMLEEIDYTPVADLFRLQDEVAALNMEVAELKVENNEYRSTLASLLNLRDSLYRDNHLDDSNPSEESESDDHGTEETESGLDESATERGLESVSESESTDTGNPFS